MDMKFQTRIGYEYRNYCYTGNGFGFEYKIFKEFQKKNTNNVSQSDSTPIRYYWKLLFRIRLRLGKYTYIFLYWMSDSFGYVYVAPQHPCL